MKSTQDLKEEAGEMTQEIKEAISSIEKMEGLSAEDKVNYIDRLKNGEDQYDISEEILKKLAEE